MGGILGALAASHVVGASVRERGNVRGRENAFQERASSLNTATARIAALNSAEITYSLIHCMAIANWES